MKSEPRIYGIVGRNIGYSLSPIIYNALFRAQGLTACYRTFDLKDRSLEQFVSAAGIIGLSGFNVTIPFKGEIVSYLHKLDPAADATVAANMVIARRNGLVGYNTDYPGIKATVENRLKCNIQGQKVALIGSGGSARTAFRYLWKKRAGAIAVYHRSRESERRFEAFVESLDAGRNYVPVRYSDRLSLDEDTVLCINATPALITRLLAGRMIPAGVRVFELRYFGRQVARPYVVNGEYMLAVQAALNYKIMTGIDVPVSRIMNIVKKARPK